MRVTPDTNFFISATQWDYSISHNLLIKLIETDTKIFTTKEILQELKEVLERDFKYLKEEADKIIKTISQLVIIVEPKQKLNIIEEDPEDNIILECAVESNSDYILTYDKHILKFKEFQNIKILTPNELFEILNK